MAVAPWTGVIAYASGSPAQAARQVGRTQVVGESAPDSVAALPAYPLDANVSNEQPKSSWLAASKRLQQATVGLSTLGRGPLSPNVASAAGIPRVALEAYEQAAGREAALAPHCGLSWPVLAGIGYIESNHGRDGGSASRSWSGVAQPPILGPLLDGSNGVGFVADTDRGLLDGNSRFDRAVGPMQFIPSTWREWGTSASGSEAPNPENIFDATLSAARYLCADGANLRTPEGLIGAVYAYNHSFDYVTAVLTTALGYGGGSAPAVAAGLADLPALAVAVATVPLPATGVANPSPPTVGPARANRPAPPPSPTPSPTPSRTPSPTPASSATPDSSASPSAPPSPSPSAPAPSGTP